MRVMISHMRITIIPGVHENIQDTQLICSSYHRIFVLQILPPIARRAALLYGTARDISQRYRYRRNSFIYSYVLCVRQ